MLAVIDFDSNNTGSVLNALDALGIPHTVVKNKADMITDVSGLIVPGVGHFQAAMERLEAKELDAVIVDAAYRGMPILGICLGMQLLTKTSDETWGNSESTIKGLGIVPADVRNIKKRLPKYRVPHMGWNDINESSIDTLSDNDKETFYFVHSHEVIARDDSNLVVAETNDSESILAAYQYKNIIGFQFHPEKSQSSGLRLLKLFWKEICCESA